MISSLGFIPNTAGKQTLSQFTPDEDIKQRLSYLQIPIIDPTEKEEASGESEDAIEPTDSLLFCTPNSEDISTLAVYVYNDEDLFVHHDLFVFSTILDSVHIGNGLLALATFEPDIFIYDAFTHFPILPQRLLGGHTGPVTGLACAEGRLMSCGDDGRVIEWDLNRLCVAGSTEMGAGGAKPSILASTDVAVADTNYDVAIERFDFSGSNIAFGASTFLRINNENMFVQGDVERIKIRESNVYVLDSLGNIVVYDTRNLQSVLYTKKIHQDSAMSIAFSADGRIATASMDKTVKAWKEEAGELAETACFSKSAAVYSLGFDSAGRLFCGDENDLISEIVFSK